VAFFMAPVFTEMPVGTPVPNNHWDIQAGIIYFLKPK